MARVYATSRHDVFLLFGNRAGGRGRESAGPQGEAKIKQRA